MELQRTEYPSMLRSLQPHQAIQTLNNRLNYIKTVNADVAEWIAERKRVEEQYAIGLKKLANRPLSQEQLDLGVFDVPWKKIISSTETIANSHQAFARSIENDVEKPLRSFATTNREVANMETILGNIQALAKDVEAATKRAEKLNSKGGKADAQKVANAASGVEDAELHWDSQAPYVFERLQEIDEIRLELLQKTLTQFQTYADEAKNSASASLEECLNALLNVQLADEIVLFAQKSRQGGSITRERRMSRPQQPVFQESSSLAPPPVPSQHDASSIRSGSFMEQPQEERKSKLSGLKRFSTVLKSRRQSTHPYGQPLQSPEKKRSSTNVGSKFSSFTKKQSQPGETLSPQSSGNRPTLESQQTADGPSDISASRSLERIASSSSRPQVSERSPELPLENVNGNHLPIVPVSGDASTALFNPYETTAPVLPAVTEQAGKDVSSPHKGGSDAINQAMSEAAAVSGDNQGQFKVDIRNAPIQEEDADSSAALASVATALRSQATPRRNPTLRGRRDRNTIILPSTSQPELPPPLLAATANSHPSIPGLPSPANLLPSPLAASSSLASPVTSPVRQLSPGPAVNSPTIPGQSITKPLSRSALLADETNASDTHSIRSGRSLSSNVSNTIRHPDMGGPGLNASIVETVSAWFEAGTCTRATQIGEIALVYNSNDAETTGQDTIRFEDFDSLDKVIPNPLFIDPIAGKNGSYSIHLSHISRTSVAFKYQTHISDNAASFAPLVLVPAWKVEASQTLVMLSYHFNPAFAAKISKDATSITLSNVILIIHLDPGEGKILRCQAQGGGTYSRERNVVYWRLNEITLPRDGTPQALRARFFTDGEATPGNAEARWEISGDYLSAQGSGVALSRLEGPDSAFENPPDDPFADEGGSSTPTVTWEEIELVRRLRAGTYVGSS